MWPHRVKALSHRLKLCGPVRQSDRQVRCETDIARARWKGASLLPAWPCLISFVLSWIFLKKIRLARLGTDLLRAFTAASFFFPFRSRECKEDWIMCTRVSFLSLFVYRDERTPPQTQWINFLSCGISLWLQGNDFLSCSISLWLQAMIVSIPDLQVGEVWGSVACS